jgi:hypothetical protein
MRAVTDDPIQDPVQPAHTPMLSLDAAEFHDIDYSGREALSENERGRLACAGILYLYAG